MMTELFSKESLCQALGGEEKCREFLLSNYLSYFDLHIKEGVMRLAGERVNSFGLTGLPLIKQVCLAVIKIGSANDFYTKDKDRVFVFPAKCYYKNTTENQSTGVVDNVLESIYPLMPFSDLMLEAYLDGNTHSIPLWTHAKCMDNSSSALWKCALGNQIPYAEHLFDNASMKQDAGSCFSELQIKSDYLSFVE